MEIVAVIDDDRSIRTALSSLLRSAGYRAVLYENAEAFLEEQPAAPADCVITDLQMPGIGGIGLLEVLQKEEKLIPVIVVTAFPEAALKRRVMDLGALAFLSKPFDATMLLSTINDALAGRT
jgi:FixJ family two-component response regulator